MIYLHTSSNEIQLLLLWFGYLDYSLKKIVNLCHLCSIYWRHKSGPFWYGTPHFGALLTLFWGNLDILKHLTEPILYCYWQIVLVYKWRKMQNHFILLWDEHDFGNMLSSVIHGCENTWGFSSWVWVFLWCFIIVVSLNQTGENYFSCGSTSCA